MKSWLYISARRAVADSSMGDIEDIVAVSRPRNAMLALTGALVATPDHYAEILEGPLQGLMEVMDSVLADPRHTDVRTMLLEDQVRREFSTWSLAYSGESNFVSDLLETAINAPIIDLEHHARGIRNLIAMFA